MYHHHSQQQGSQPFSNGPRPPHHQPPPNQDQNRPPSDMLSQVMGFQFPRPTQLPDELESALAIRGARDMDHRLIDHMSQPNQQQNQSTGSAISQHGSYGSNPMTLSSDNPSGHQQGVDWSSYQPPNKLFASPPPSASHQAQRHQGAQQQPQSSHAGTSISSWTAPGSGGSGGGDGQGLYTPESAGSILASFGLSNEDLEVLSHYPDDQLTPDTLPFILRDIQINKSGSQKASTSSSSYSCGVHDMKLPASRSPPMAHSRSPEVPSLLTVTQTAGKVIDYGHASRAKDESSTRETFKREQLSSERTVKMYPSSSSSSSAAPKADKAERRQVRLEHTESSKHGDKDYRRTSNDHRKSNRSPGREFPPSSKSRNLDRDYRRDRPKPGPTSETRGEASLRRSLSSSSGSKPQSSSSSSSKKLPTPTMISDFSAVSPKVYPHTCSLCHIQCDQEKDWVNHINTVNHTAACRDLRNKYPDWKPNLPSRSGRYGSRALWDPKDHSPSQSTSRSLSCSPTPSPPHSKRGVGPHLHRPHRGPYLPHHHPRHQHYTGGSSRRDVKRPLDDSPKFSSKMGHGAKHGPLQFSARTVKSGSKPGTKMIKTASAKAADTSVRPPPAKKKKKITTPASHDSSVADRLVYLTGIPKDASEQDVTDLVGSFGKINNVILMSCSEEESEKGQGQKASVCMVKAEDAQALANSTDLSIRDQKITVSVAKKPEAVQSSDGNNSKPAPGQDRCAAGEDSAGGEADQKTADEKSMLLITGLPESGWSESDIIKLLQPFGTPSDIILATKIGKVLVSVPDVDIAQEIVKVHTFMPMKIQDCDLKVVHLKQCIGISAPVALYNLLMGSVDPLESSVPVGWSSLLVISNVPNTPSGSSEVQKLVRRFGTVIKTLVLNNMVICEMATAAMALSVYKRFQAFPCIIQNNPLFFSRKPDPRANTQTKVISAYLDSVEDTTANGKGGQTSAAVDEEKTAHKEDSESAVEGMEKEDEGTDEKMKSREKMDGENKSKDDDIKKDELINSDSSVAPDAKPEVDLEMMETSANETVETAEEEKDAKASKAENDKTPAGEDTKPSKSHNKAASPEMALPQLPKVTQAMVNALLVQCRTRTVSQLNSTEAPTNGEQGETQTETVPGEKAAETEEPAKNHPEEEVKKQDRERKEREARKEKEVRERERKERERRAWEKEERSRKEREWNDRVRRKREEEKREWLRRDRERKTRRRTHDEETRWSRSGGHKEHSGRDEHHKNSEAVTKTVEKEAEFDEFSFNMSDFVTVDEVGDVTDLPRSPSPTVPMETTEDAPVSAPKDAPGDTPIEVKSDEHESQPQHVTVPEAETSDGVESSAGLVLNAAASPSPDSQCDSSLSQTHAPTCQPEAPESETTLTATLDSTTEVEPFLTPAPAASAAPADSSPNSPAAVEATAEMVEDEKKHNAHNHSEAKQEEEIAVVSDKSNGCNKMQDGVDKETVLPATETGVSVTGKHERSEDQADTEEQSVKKKFKTETPMSTNLPLPPFDPSSPVGMEFLVPKTGFFCKACNRFFTGTKEAEFNHCKTFKHYENLQKYLKTMEMPNETTKRDSS